MRAVEQICQQLNCPELADGLERALKHFGFGADDVRCGAAHLAKWYDLELPGVRQLVSAYLKEFCALYETSDRYRIYVSVPSPTVLSAALNGTGRIRVYTAELCAMIVLRGILSLSLESVGNCCEVQSRCEMLKTAANS